MRSSLLLSSAVLGSVLLVGCGSALKSSEPHETSGSRSALFSTDSIALEAAKNLHIRGSATLGIFVTEYLTNAPLESAVQGALNAIAIQSVIMDAQENVSDPDFELLQAFQDALQVDVADLLNRSENREQALDTYSEALTNIATRAHDRYKELSSSYEELKKLVRTLGKEKNDADREVKKALKEKNYEAASRTQKALSEKEAEYADAELKSRQVQDIVTSLDQMLNLYGQKILAIQQNREVLLSGMTVVDVPGIDDLKIIRREKSKYSSGKNGESFNGLFQGAGLR